jgi:hypothetical protein
VLADDDGDLRGEFDVAVNKQPWSSVMRVELAADGMANRPLQFLDSLDHWCLVNLCLAGADFVMAMCWSV